MAAQLADPLAAPARPSATTAPVARSRFGLAAWRSLPLVRRFLYVLVALYVVKQAIFVVAFPPFSGHDEVAHFSYLDVLATEGRIPVLPDLEQWRIDSRSGGDAQMDILLDELYPYCDYALYWHCEPEKPQWAANPPRAVVWPPTRQYYPTGELYTANHPPLYYALMTPLYRAMPTLSVEIQQYLLRLATIPFGIMTVVLAYLLARTLFPTDVFLAITVPTFVAFQPQVSYVAAMVNNDIVAIAAYSLVLYLIVRGIRHRFPPRLCLALGAALGFGLLAKSTLLTAAPIIAVAVIFAVGWRDVRAWLGRGTIVVIPAALLAAPWYVFMYRTYGNFDALDQIAALQEYWNEPAGTFWGMLTSPAFVAMRFRETWGEFGWRRMPLDPWLLWAIAIPLIVAVVGLLRYLFAGARRSRQHGDTSVPDRDPLAALERWQWVSLAVLAIACAVAYLAVIQFGTRFSLTQARYFFPVVNAASLLLMLGLRTLIPPRFHHYGQGAVFAAMLMLNVVIFTQYVIPYYLSV